MKEKRIREHTVLGAIGGHAPESEVAILREASRRQGALLYGEESTKRMLLRQRNSGNGRRRQTDRLLDAQCVGRVYTGSAMRGNECGTQPRRTENQDSKCDYKRVGGFHLI